MKKLALVSMMTAALITTPLALAGNPKSPLVDKRGQHQVQRIKQGVRSGALTGRETMRLVGDQIRIRQKEKQFKADGKLTVKERFKLHRGLNKSSRRIYGQKHDAQTR